MTKLAHQGNRINQSHTSNKRRAVFKAQFRSDTKWYAFLLHTVGFKNKQVDLVFKDSEMQLEKIRQSHVKLSSNKIIV